MQETATEAKTATLAQRRCTNCSWGGRETPNGRTTKEKTEDPVKLEVKKMVTFSSGAAPITCYKTEEMKQPMPKSGNFDSYGAVYRHCQSEEGKIP